MEVSSTPAQGAAATNGVATPSFPTIEPERVVEHLSSVCQIALGATQQDLEQPGSLLHQSRYGETASRSTRYANDTQNVLYIQKDVASSASATVENGADSSGESPSLRLLDFC